MKIEIELNDKLKQPLGEVLKAVKETNEDKEITKERILAEVCKQYIAQEYGKLLMRE